MKLNIGQLKKQTKQLRGKLLIKRPDLLGKKVSQRKLVFRGRATGASAENYSCYIAFPFQAGKDLYAMNADKKVGVKAPTVKTACEVRCTCKDFQFTWSRANSKVGTLYGKEFVLPTPTGTGKPRNPQQLPGMCKHLLGLAAVLSDVDYLRK